MNSVDHMHEKGQHTELTITQQYIYMMEKKASFYTFVQTHLQLHR